MIKFDDKRLGVVGCGSRCCLKGSVNLHMILSSIDVLSESGVGVNFGAILLYIVIEISVTISFIRILEYELENSKRQGSQKERKV
jgi:hypothetical protein